MSRLPALIGVVAHGVDRAVTALLWFVPFRVPGALLLAALLGFLAWQQTAAANQTLASYPTPRPTTIAAILDGDASGWLRIDGLISGPYLDSRSYTPADQGGIVRYYYIVRDATRSQALVVRSPREAAEIGSARTLLVRIERRREAVAAAVAALNAGSGLSVDADRYLLELPSTEQAVAASPTPRAVDPSNVRGEEGQIALFSGSFGPSRRVSCGAGEPACRDGTAYEYLVGDGAHGVIVRSPYSPDALPVTLTGVMTPDAFRMQTALENADLARALHGAATLDEQLFSDGVTPPLPEVTFAPAVVLTGIAAFLLISKLVGYPIFRRRREPAAAGAPLAPGEELRLEISGRVRGAHGTVTLDREPGTLGRLTAVQVARREWQFGGRPLAETGLEDALDPTSTQPVLTSGGGSLLLLLDSLTRVLRMTAGQLVTVGATYPSLRLRAPGIDAVLGFEDEVTRARALAEIDPSRPRGASLATPTAEMPARPGTVAPEGAADRRPWQLTAVALFFAVSGAGLLAAGLIGLLPSAEPRHPIAVLLPALVQSAIGCGLALVASGLWRRQEWAREMGLNLGAAGVVASLILAFGETTCLRPLGPTLAACQPGDLVGGLLALIALAGFGLSVWAIVKLRPYFR
ncbi:MAG: hypothetical protein M3O77_00435 [Chloroflexota bacterium]|nr:hypothetical protein [Chloroflexota bacterium]